MAKKVVKVKRDYTGYLKKACALAGIGLVGGLAGMSGGALISNPVVVTNVDVDELSTQISDKVLTDLPSTDNALVTDMHDKMFEEDAWEAEAEVIASEEWEERDYKDVFDKLHNCDDRDDIKYVKVKDTRFTGMDADDKDGTVSQDLKVRYENINGTTVNEYFTVNTTIIDNEIESQTFD